MVAVALVGPDGAGKTTVAKGVQDALGDRVKYIYMGNNPDSSQFSLPTSRAVHRAKVRKAEKSGSVSRSDAAASLHSLEHRTLTRGVPWRAARMLNRITEASAREVLAQSHERRGNLVIFDRHPRFETGRTSTNRKPRTERAYRWFVWSVLPEPDLVILLGAPSDLLFERTQEVPVEYLDKAQRSYRAIGHTCANFVEIDAAQQPHEVINDVLQSISLIYPSNDQTEAMTP